jgi:catechol 2,3-dioxygenase-like lactoylglutathione lyase family enzyme
MKVKHIDHISIIVKDLAAATAFFLDFGLELQGEGALEGALVDTITGLEGVKNAIAFLRASDGGAAIELVQFYNPMDENSVQPPQANTLGIRHIAFVVEDIDAHVERFKARGVELFSEVQQYEDSYKLCYVRGPEGIILELAESLK